MKRSRFSDEQIIAMLRENEAGAKVDDICRRHGVSGATFYVWRKKFGGMERSDARRSALGWLSPLEFLTNTAVPPLTTTDEPECSSLAWP